MAKILIQVLFTLILVIVGEVMKKNVFLKVSGKIFLLTLIPILLVIKLGWDSILPIIVYLQFLLIWAQTEIGIRQAVLSSSQFEPSFDIKEETETEVFGHDSIFPVYIVNISDNPAYNLGIGRILDKKGQPIFPQLWPKSLVRSHISCLPPKQSLKLYSIRLDEREKLLEDEVCFEVLYFNKFGDLRTFWIKFSKNHPPLLIHERVEKPGVLLNSLEEILILWKFYRVQQKISEKPFRK